MCVLVIGIGNSLRGDDGGGIVAAQALGAPWDAAGLAHRLLLTHQLLPEIAEDLAQPEVKAVLFVDTAVRPPATDAHALGLAACRLRGGGGL
ncbi:MAG: hypothetical protein WDZ49_15755 [Litorilinea sp.]